jgi:RNA polymerase sigma-70 factor (ECF subfamily)
MAKSDLKRASGSLAVETISDFDAIYYRYHTAVYANIFKMVKQSQAAEDILQEVFFSLWKNREKIMADGVGGWLFVVSYNKAATYLKTSLRHSFLYLHDVDSIEDLSSDDASADAPYQKQLTVIEDALRHLPARKKEVFLLHYFEGRSHEEIASLLGISANSVKDYLKQAGSFIRKYAYRNSGAVVGVTISLMIVGPAMS